MLLLDAPLHHLRRARRYAVLPEKARTRQYFPVCLARPQALPAGIVARHRVVTGEVDTQLT
ncbi:hypothetical protein GCM10020229_24860 [Kitasatospora albolonga]|uniref:hypothetical protein n=1 Tax=Kitasatospora albolonga TaxID=68173 RepID=UPI0031EDAB55